MPSERTHNEHGLPTSGKLSYLYERTPTHRHRGIDLAAPEGSAVFAAATGKVTHATASYVDGFGGYGRVVAIAADDGTHQLYAHLQRASVTPGQRVRAGQIIGAVGRTAYTKEDPTAEYPSGPHLHFEVSPNRYPLRKEADRVDPVAWLMKGGNVHPLRGYSIGGRGGSSEPISNSFEGPWQLDGDGVITTPENIRFERVAGIAIVVGLGIGIAIAAFGGR